MPCKICERNHEILDALANIPGSNPDGSFAEGEFEALYLNGQIAIAKEQMFAMRDSLTMAQMALRKAFKAMLHRPSMSPEGDRWVFYKPQQIAKFLTVYAIATIPAYSGKRSYAFQKDEFCGHHDLGLEWSEAPESEYLIGVWAEDVVDAFLRVAGYGRQGALKFDWVEFKLSELKRGLDIIAPVREPPCGSPFHSECNLCQPGI